MYETSRQSRFDARYWMLEAGALGRPRGMVWGGRREESSGWGTHVYLWWIHFDILQNQYNIVKFKNKIKDYYKKKKGILEWVAMPYPGTARFKMFLLLFMFVLCIICVKNIIKLLNYSNIYSQLS